MSLNKVIRGGGCLIEMVSHRSFTMYEKSLGKNSLEYRRIPLV